MDRITFTIMKAARVADNAMVVYLKPVGGELVRYEAGQFLTFIINHYGREVRRSYSIASTPGIDPVLFVVIKRLENGEISRYLTDHLKPGDHMTTLPPSGRFTIENSQHPRTLFFVAAGSGITPIYAMLKKVLSGETASRIVLIIQNRNEESAIFRQELDALHLQYPERFHLISFLSNPASHDKPPQRLNNFLMEQLLSRYYNPDEETLFYLCGPFAFMRMVQFVLRFTGVQEAAIRRENFVIAAAPPPPLLVDRSVKQVLLRWKGRQYRFDVTYPENILQAALQHNIHLPYSCRGGRCSTCTVTCVSGSVVMSINEVLTDRDLRQGLVLTCVGYAKTDLELEI